MSDDGHPNMHKPTWRYEFNLNSVILTVTFLAGVAGWGVMYEQIRGALKVHDDAITALRTDVAALEAADRLAEPQVADLRWRVTALEAAAKSVSELQRELAKAQQDMERTIGALASDVRVTREVVQRIDRQLGDEPARAKR
ncbi:hypothetical protein [Methylobrevis pamukkalensis]|uniref:hypothetical protein n=1 Tax=Methylobrevis pamukkalensis TaxID=1439726 RepID=UPI00114C8BD1|nr:hypothetical protein [Methylobrevis pamukkalensis]